MLQHCHKKLSKMEKDTSPEYLFLVRLDGHNTVSQVTVADCVASAPLQSAWEMFGIDLAGSHPRLGQLYEAFKNRRSAVVPNRVWPPQLTETTTKWIAY
jgi:hypothetical protein